MEKDRFGCQICQGTGFANGKVCICISGLKEEESPELPDIFKDIFGDIFGGFSPDTQSKSNRNR
jgi:hypothetical protein